MCLGQAFDYARSKAGDVTELFDVLAGKLRPDRQTPGGGEGLGGTSLSTKSVLRAHYNGSADSTVLGMANLKRIQTFLDEPQKHLGQVMESDRQHDTTTAAISGWDWCGMIKMGFEAPCRPVGTAAQRNRKCANHCRRTNRQSVRE